MTEQEKYPPKIQTLFLLRKIGACVPQFIVIDNNEVENIQRALKKVRIFFRDKGAENLIIRSALSCEDSKRKTFAGIFESSKAVPVEELKSDLFLKYWRINKKKADSAAGGADLRLFIQEYISSDYSGVLFTQNIFDRSEALLNLSAEKFSVTEGKDNVKKVCYDKHKGKWTAGEFLPIKSKRELEEKIPLIEEEFPEGADVELGIKGDTVWFWQARPIIRNPDEKILIEEKKRLIELFKKDFRSQEWIKNSFIRTVGDLSDMSVDFYNSLFCSLDLRDLLLQAGLINKGKLGRLPDNCRILENIGGKTFYNIREEEKLFPGYRCCANSFIKNLKILIFEKVMAKKSVDDLSQKNLSIQKKFSWFFLAAVYFQYFAEIEKRKLTNSDFAERLRNTEKVCRAKEPRPEGLDTEEIEKFKERYYFWSWEPYELTYPRLSELSNSKIINRYASFMKPADCSESKKTLGKRSQFWLRQKVQWKESFLKSFYSYSMKSARHIRNCKANLLSDNFTVISGRNYPFSKSKKNKETVIVPGKIDFENIVLLNSAEDIFRYENKVVAIRNFPVSKINVIPFLKGLILREGNEFSHVSITCREYQVPCRISPQFFSRLKREDSNTV